MSYLDQIEKYLNGEMKGEELRRFEERIRTNPRLAEDTQLYKELTGFLANNIDSVDDLVNSIEELNQSIMDDEWNNPENAHLVSRIKKFMTYLGDSLSADIEHWLKTEAILYPELLDDIISNIDEKRFNKGTLTREECFELYRNLTQAYESFKTINEAVDEYLLSKPLPEAYEHQTEKKTFENTKVLPLLTINAERTENRKKNRRMLISRIAASLALFVAAGTILLLVQMQKTSGDSLYDQYNTDYSLSTIQRSSLTVNNTGSYQTGMTLYQNKAWEAAISEFSGVSVNDPDYIPARFFMGLAQMQLNDFNAAVSSFTKVIRAGKSNLAADAQWKLAMCYLKLNNLEQTRLLLKEIAATNPFYKQKAQELLGKLPR